MAVQLSLDHCSVVLMGRRQGEKVGTNVTDCGSDPFLMARGEQSRETGHQTLHIMHWNAEGVPQKKLELQQFLRAKTKKRCLLQPGNSSQHSADPADRPRQGELTLVKTTLPSIEVQGSEEADME